MGGISRNGIDSAGGIITSAGQSKFYVNGSLAIVHGDPVTPHGIGVHAGPTMIANTTKVFINGKAVVQAGDLATCGHASSGSANVFID